MTDFLSQYQPQTCDVNGETLIYFGDKDQAYCIPNKGFFVLPHMSVLSIEGADAITFLQGQLTVDVTEIKADQIGLYCNKEGRIICLFYIHKEHDTYHLIMPKSILRQTEKTIKRYAMFSKVSITTSPLSVLMIKENNTLSPLLVPKEELALMCQGLEKKQPMLGSLSWLYYQLQQHVPSIYPSTIETWLPHKIGLHLKNALNFEKGCYLGQEIIARMHFKAKLKHSPLCYISTTHKGLGDKLNIDGKVVGEVIDTCPYKDNLSVILASLLTTVIPQVEADPNCIS